MPHVQSRGDEERSKEVREDSTAKTSLAFVFLNLLIPEREKKERE